MIRAIQSGDAAAFETLYYRYRDWVVGLAWRFCRNHDDALDVLQETFAYLFRKLEGFELRSQFKTFLYPAVKHLSLNRARAARRQVLMESVPDRPTVDNPPSGLDEYLKDLTGEQRETVQLRFVDGLSLQEIAEAMEVPLGTVKSRLHVALGALRENFAGE